MNYLKNVGMPDVMEHLDAKGTVIVACVSIAACVVKYAIEKGYTLSLNIKDQIELNIVPGKEDI